MSNAKEFETVDVPEPEEEDALSNDEVMPELGNNPAQGGIILRPLVPLDRRGALRIHIGDEFRLRNNYDILPPVLLHFQNPVTLFASFILWHTVLEARMTIPEFFNIYRVNYKREGVVEFTVRENPIFIFLSQSYSNNRGWRSEFFRVSGEWESATPLAENQRMSREWRPIQIDLREPPALNATRRRRVATMLTFSQTPTNVLKIDYDNIVTDENMRKALKYEIPTGKVLYDRKGKTMVRKSGSEAAPTLRAVACPSQY